MTEKLMPVVFVGHGSPMNAIEENRWSHAFRALGRELPRPRAILAISAHWWVPGIHVTGQERPPTIHDFGGFPRALYEMQYPAPGDVALAERTRELVGRDRASLRREWGLDHGTWSVLHHLRPKADCPVVQLSIDERMAPEQHLELGRALRPLREEGVMILASGNVTHNLRHAFGSDGSTPDWASSFDADVARALEQHEAGFLARLISTGHGRMAHPSPDHYMPLLYAAGASGDGDAVRFPISGFDLGSLSMRSVVLG